MPYFKAIVEPLLAHPDHATYTQTNDEMGVLLTLKVHKEDMGKILGKQGATIKAIRALMHVWGMSNNARVSVKVDEPDGSKRNFRLKSDLDDVIKDYSTSRGISASMYDKGDN